MFVNKNIDGFNMSLNLGDRGISNVLYQKGYREKAFMSILKRTIYEGMVCMDLGANIGFTTLPMLRNVGNSGKVYAIEPDPRSYSLLRTNVGQNNFNDRCEFTKCIISNETVEKEFWLSSQPNLSSVQKTPKSTKKINIQSFTLEDFLKDRNYVNFIKMDVEGHEVKILEGGLEYFKKNRGATNILLEVHPKFYNDENSLADILEKYFQIGFNAKYTVSTPVYQPRLFAEAGYTPVEEVYTDGFKRGIYKDIKNDDLIKFACFENEEPYYRDAQEGHKISKKIVRSFLISREK